MKKIYISFDSINNGIRWVDTKLGEDDDGASQESPLIELTLEDDGNIVWQVHTGQR